MKLDFDTLDFEMFEEISKKALSINKEVIDDEMTLHSITYSYYQGLYIKFKHLYERQLNEFESTVSLLRNQELLKNKSIGAKATAHYLDDYIKSLPEHKEGRNKLIDIEEKLGYLQIISKAMEHKKDMLVQISSNKRAESKLYS